MGHGAAAGLWRDEQEEGRTENDPREREGGREG